MSPYCLYLPYEVPLGIVNNRYVNNFIRFFFQIRIISRWLFFIGYIYLMNYLYNYNNIKYEYEDDINSSL